MTFRGFIYGTAVQLFFLSMLFARESDAQNIQSVREATISMDLRNASLKECFLEVEKQTDYKFSFDHFLIDPKVTINYKSRNKTVSEFLMKISKEASLRFKQINNNINVQRVLEQTKEQVPTIEVIIQGRTVTGKIISGEDNTGLPGVNVIVKGTSQGTVTDFEGNYSVNVPEDNGILVYSSVGYISQEVTVGNRSVIDLTLEPDVKALEEIVVVGYGTVKKSDLTGSVSSVKTEEIKDMPLASFDQGLQGRAAGVQVTQTSGQPGAVASIRIRGGNSIQGGNEPLFVVDGFPIYSGGGVASPGAGPSINPLATINPNDIESIEVLKDASATAIYGARGANGVILITTKGGSKGSDLISFDSFVGVQQVGKTMDIMNATQFAELVNEAYTNDGLDPVYTQDEINSFGEGTNWQDEIFRSAPVQNYQIGFSGGDDKTTYAISANYFSQDGTVINSFFDRISGRVNVDRKISKRVSIGSHLNVSRTKSNTVRTDTDGGGGTGVVLGSIMMNPVQPVYTDEEKGEYTLLNDRGILVPNPVATANEIVNENILSRVLGDVYGNWEILDGLKLRISAGADVLHNKGNLYFPSYIYQGIGNNGIGTVRSVLNSTWLNENTLTYDRNINENHYINVLAGVTFQGNRTEFVQASSQEFVTDALEENSLGSGAVYNQPGTDATEWGLTSYIGRVNYHFMDRYLFTATARVDGSSRFGEGNKYGFFPSGSFAWRVKDEPFLQSVDIISDLKVRTSYGIIGNQEIGLFNSLATMASNTYAFGGALATGFRPSRIPNPDLQWERTAQFDIGFDVAFFDNRLRVTTDWYHKRTTDLLYSLSVPWTSGFSSSLQNIGSVENKGLEFAFESDNLVGDFAWSTSFNIAFNRNKVIDLGEIDFFYTDAGSGHLKVNQLSRVEVGRPIGQFWGYVFDGVYQNQEEIDNGAQPNAKPGDRRFKDLDGDGAITAENDRTYIGNAQPDFFGGITNNLSYKGFEFSFFFQGTYGNDLYNYNRIELELPTGGQNVSADMVNRWTSSNPSNIFPRATRQRSILQSSRQVEDGSFLRLRTVTLAYNFDVSELSWIRKLRLYVTGQNLWTLTNYSGFDPEVSRYGATNLNIGQDYGGYPIAQTYTLGLNVNF
jgi:TonB-linked SusC/RagA family outer membrane protein